MFAELVEKLEDESWREAIETFLGKKRYYFIVDAKCCRNVLEIVQKNKLYKANVVLTDKLPDSVITEQSAASQLVIPNIYARRYANYLLNGIHLCENLEELHEYPLGGITRDGMLAKSYAVSCMDMTNTEMCLGSHAIKLQKEKAEGDKNKLQNEISKCKSGRDIIIEKLSWLNKLDVNIDNYSFEAPEVLLDSKVKIQNISADIDNLSNNPDFAKILIEQNKAKELLDAVEAKNEENLKSIGALQNEIISNKSKRENEQTNLDAANNLFNEKRLAQPDVVYEAEEEYEKQVLSRGTVKVLTEKYVKNLAADVEKASRTLEDRQLEYCKVAEMDNTRRGVAYIPFYREQFNSLSNVKLEEAKNKMHEQEQSLQSAFMHDFIGEISEAIREAKDEIDGINRELKQIPFGQDTYQFKMKEKSDRAIFFRIANKIADYMSPEMYMAVNGDDEEMEHDIRQFMETILDEEDESEYTDYRRYFVYDMEISRNLGEKFVTADLSKKQGSASNGEKQTPYFIILAASLMQCYPRNTCCARLAFIDEAFAALSRERIEQMVRYFEDHDFQVIYAAPPEKIVSIGQYINTTVSLYPKGSYSYAIEGLYAN